MEKKKKMVKVGIEGIVRIFIVQRFDFIKCKKLNSILLQILQYASTILLKLGFKLVKNTGLQVQIIMFLAWNPQIVVWIYIVLIRVFSVFLINFDITQNLDLLMVSIFNENSNELSSSAFQKVFF